MSRSAEEIERIQEMQANAFARELLMPEEAFRAVVWRMNSDLYDNVTIRKLASLFQVPETAVVERLVELEMLL